MDEKEKSYSYFPLRYPELADLATKQRLSLWGPEEIDMTLDIKQFKELTENERTFIENVLAFFATSDGVVNENLAARFMNDINIPEAKGFYAYQICIEQVHSETYAKMLTSLVTDENKLNNLMFAIDNVEVIKNKANWAKKYITDSKIFSERLIAFAIVEGIFFSSSFAAIFWLKSRNIMPGLYQANKFISRDESSHTLFAITLYNNYFDKIDNSLIINMVNEAVELEKDFVRESLKCSLFGINQNLMIEYVEFMADRFLQQLNIPKYYKTNFPESLRFMDTINLESKTNFFDLKSPDYQKASISSKFIQDDDF